MFEEMTFENILEDMLGRVRSDIDKREGSVIYDALAPCAYKLAETYFQLNNFIDLVSGDTAVGEYLDRVVADYGIKRKPATQAVRRVETTGPIDISTRWGLNETTYIITEKISDTEYFATCEQYGEIGSSYTGQLDNIDNISGITAMLTNVILSGFDGEDDENLRGRFYIQVQSPSTSGNANDYMKWALDVPGVGDAKVFPLWDGPGTVKVIVVDSSMEIDETLEVEVHNYIEILRPIGATVTVDSPIGIAINATANITLDGTRTLQEVKDGFNFAFAEYLKETVFETYSVSYARVGSILLSTPGVGDYSDLLVNEDTQNITIGETEMPIAGTVILSEVV